MLDAIIWLKNGIYPGADPEILKKRALFTGHWMVDKKISRFRWSKKAKITLETISFYDIFLSVFSNFLHF